MIILAGIDEAGLGPTLGPLVTACCALAVPDAWTPDSPWTEMEAAFCREWRKGETRAGVSDSKILYRTGGIAALELTVGAFARAVDADAAPGPALADSGAATRHPCYSGTVEPFPVHNEPSAVEQAAAAMRGALQRCGAAAAHLEAALLFEPALNHRFATGLNKNQALLMETGRHLTRLAEKHPGPILAVVDKQGGRNDYLPFLTALFPGVWLDVLEAGAERSRYRLRRPGGAMEIWFQAKADRTSFATALASLAAKYMRERAMAELNGWFRNLLPDLRDTAGYPGDAERWLEDVRAGTGAEALLELIIRNR